MTFRFSRLIAIVRAYLAHTTFAGAIMVDAAGAERSDGRPRALFRVVHGRPRHAIIRPAVICRQEEIDCEI